MITVRIRRLLLWVALPALVLVLLYTVLGFYVVPRLLRSGVHDFVSKNYHREAAVGDIRFNPYTLRLDVRDFSLPDEDGKPMLAFQHLLVNLTVASIWRLGPDFEAIVLEQPFARVLIKQDGTLNFSALALPPSPDAKPAPSNAKPARLFIKHFSVVGGNVAFEDLAHASPFRTEIKPITFDLRDFATVGKDVGQYALNGSSEAGERFAWTGTLDTYPLTSRGKFEVANLQATTIWGYLRDSVQFELPSGAISIAGEYDFNAATSPVGLGVTVHDVTVTDLGIRPKGVADEYLKIVRLEVHETRADVARRTVDVGSVRVAGAEVRAWAPGGGGAAVNLMELAGGGGAPVAGGTADTPVAGTGGAPVAGTGEAPAAGGTGGAGSANGPPAADVPAWTVSVPDIALDNLKISAEDRQISPAVPVLLDELSIHVTGFSTSHTNPVAVVMSTKINRSGKLDAKADLTPDLAGLKGEANLANLDLTVLQPYIGRQTAMTLRSGLLSSKLNVERAADGHMSVGGELDIAKLRTVDNELKRDFIKFESLKVTGIDYQMPSPSPSKPASLHIKNITARAPYARVIIESDRSVNVSRVLSGPNGAKEAATTAGSAGVADAVANVSSGTGDSAEPHAAISIGKVPAPPPAGGDASAGSGKPATATGAAEGASAGIVADVDAASGGARTADAAHGNRSEGKTPGGRKHSKRSGGKSTPAEAPANGDSMAITIDAINLQDGSANYADLWIQPHFAVGIQNLNGSILGLSSNPRSRAKVELNGKVDRYAPVHIWGETNPLAATTYSDIKMNFKGVELTSATPYSGHFAGYKIEKGKLSVDIDYKIDNRKLTAAHKFVIDQLELGERVESPDAIHLPLKIAVALLKDRNGVIDIDLPVTGSLDDPQFRIGPLIWKAVLNLLTKIATAPFALLGHLFGGGEQMNYIDFQPGSAVLDPSEHDKLVALVNALKEKEKLELDVPVTFSPDVDRPGLAAAHLNARLLAMSQDQASGRKRGKGGAKTNSASTGAASMPTAKAGAGAGDTISIGSAAPDAPRSPLSAIIDAPPTSDPALTEPAQRYHLLLALYRADFGKGTTLPALALAIEGEGKKKDQPPPDYGAANAELEAALLQKVPVPDTELEVLGKHRARAIQDVLLNGTDIDPSRVFVIGSAPKGPAEKDKVRVELALK